MTRFEDIDNPLDVTSSGLSVVAGEEDGVPFACPLTREQYSLERSADSFVHVCGDCPHSFISHLVSLNN